MARLEGNVPGRGIRIHQLSDPANGIWAGGDSISTSSTSKGTVLHYANGVRRAITYGAIDENLTINLPIDTVEQVELLRSWTDSTILLRSVRGEVYAGLLSAVNSTAVPTMPDDRLSCAVTINTTTTDGVV